MPEPTIIEVSLTHAGDAERDIRIRLKAGDIEAHVVGLCIEDAFQLYAKLGIALLERVCEQYEVYHKDHPTEMRSP